MPTKSAEGAGKVLADRRDMLVFNLSFQKSMLLLSEVA